MGRIRTIKPEYGAHEELSDLPAETHLLGATLLCYADDYGYFNANPILVKAGTCPLRSDKTTIERQLAQLEEVGYIEVRRSDKRAIGKIVRFAAHQRVSHPTDSKLEHLFESLPKSSGDAHETLRPEQGREQGTGNREGEAPTADAGCADRGRLLGTLPLNDGSDYEVREDDLARDTGLYPVVDVRQAYRGMKAYLLANPTKRKTRKGIRKFMNNWLSKEQDKGGRSASGQNYHNRGQAREDAALATLHRANAADRRREETGEAAPMDYSFGDSSEGAAGGGGPAGLLSSIGL